MISLLPFCEWLAGTAWSIALHESLHAYPLIETTHVLSIFLFVGSVTLVDLRLLGWAFREVPVSEMTSRILPWSIAGFGLAALTGALLFYAIPVRTYLSLFFRIKVLAMCVAAGNLGLFHHRAAREGTTWDAEDRPPGRVRAAGAVSLLCWATVIVMGRMIAYNWFDCDRQPQPDWVNLFAGCPLSEALPEP